MPSTMRRSATTLLVVLATSLGTATAAVADQGPPPPASPPPSSTIPTGATGGASDSGGVVSADSGGCHLVSTPQALGSYCPGSESDTASIKATLAGEKFIKCWDDPMTADEQATTGYTDSAPGVEPPYWAFWHRCLMGIDEKTLAVSPPIFLQQSPEYIFDRSKIVTIGPNERKLLVFTNHTIPYPIAVVSPTTQPRVGQWLSFFDGQTQDVSTGTLHEVTVNALGSTLVAREERIVVQPRGTASADSVSCPGGGHKAEVGEAAVPGGNCWYRYPTSSAGQPGQTFPVRITAYWTVTLNGQAFNTFQKSVTTTIPVTEIQAINIPTAP